MAGNAQMHSEPRIHWLSALVSIQANIGSMSILPFAGKLGRNRCGVLASSYSTSRHGWKPRAAPPQGFARGKYFWKYFWSGGGWPFWIGIR